MRTRRPTGRNGGKPSGGRSGKPGRRDGRKPARSRQGNEAGPGRFALKKRPPRRDEAPRDRPRHAAPVAPPIVEREPEAPPLPTAVQTVAVTSDEAGMRIDRFFEARFPGLSFSHIQRIIRKGEVRVDGKRAQPKGRLAAGQKVRIPPLKLATAKSPSVRSENDIKTREFLASITLYEDDDVLVLNKPMGLAVQGGSGTVRHIDGMLDVLRSRDGQRPRLVHRIDKDTAGCLLVAKNRFSAAALAKNFRSRSARKVYWALVVGVPKPKQGRI